MRLILCSICLNTFNLAGQARVDLVGGMVGILDAQRRAGKVISLYACLSMKANGLR